MVSGCSAGALSSSVTTVSIVAVVVVAEGLSMFAGSLWCVPTIVAIMVVATTAVPTTAAVILAVVLAKSPLAPEAVCAAEDASPTGITASNLWLSFSQLPAEGSASYSVIIFFRASMSLFFFVIS